jgi:hypothetical protein
MNSLVARIVRSLGLKSDAEIRQEVESEPQIKRAQRAIRLGERTLNELEALERRNGKRAK